MNELKPAHTMPFIDLNAPTQDAVSECITLWQAVILKSIRDSCACKIEAKKNKAWAKTPDFKMVCDMASLNYKIVGKKLVDIYDHELTQCETFEKISYFKSKLHIFK